MAENNKSLKDDTNSKDGLALIIGGLFILALVFATYSYFNKGKIQNTNITNTTVDNTVNTQENDTSIKDKTLGEKLKELFDSQQKGNLDGDGATTNSQGETNNKQNNQPSTTQPTQQVQGATTTSPTMTPQSKWVANNYKSGDITGASYVVKSGDTLWEIAEAKYGNGADWTKILSANSNDIKYLPNGSQALIVPGQTLVLP